MSAHRQAEQKLELEGSVRVGGGRGERGGRGATQWRALGRAGHGARRLVLAVYAVATRIDGSRRYRRHADAEGGQGRHAPHAAATGRKVATVRLPADSGQVTLEAAGVVELLLLLVAPPGTEQGVAHRQGARQGIVGPLGCIASILFYSSLYTLSLSQTGRERGRPLAKRVTWGRARRLVG